MTRILILTTICFSLILPLIADAHAASAAGPAEIFGTWDGNLNVMDTQIKIQFQIRQVGDEIKVTMDSPDQGAFDIKVDTFTYNKPNIEMQISLAAIHYSGVLEGNTITGTYKQGPWEISLDLMRVESATLRPQRPQEPREPYPYISEDVSFENLVDEIMLAGTLTYPREPGKYPAVVLISGSGPQNRDEEIMGHKPFLVIADHLSRNGIAVLRFDDRGVGDSEGTFAGATSMDFATDVEAAVNFLKKMPQIDSSRIGLIGHSEGGIIAPIVAARNSDVAYIVMLAGTGIPGYQILLAQQELIGRSRGMSEEEILNTVEINRGAFILIQDLHDSEDLNDSLEAYISSKTKDEDLPEGYTREEFIKMQYEALLDPWIMFFLLHDPATILEKVTVPVLALNGSLDLQVPPLENLRAIESALKKGGNNNVKTVELPRLNHLFQEAETGAVEEYHTIEQTFSPDALILVSEWILELKSR